MKLLLLSLLLCCLTIIAPAQETSRSKEFHITKGLGLQGYDPVAYFNQNKAVKGKKEFAFNADGIIYYLSSAANKDLFSANYKKYEPQYGGWCAYAMGENGEKVDIDPETFKLANGKLYLFYNSLFNNTLPKWNKDEKNLNARADKNWGAIYK